MNYFKLFYSKFEKLHDKLKVRDRSLDKFSHYYYKLRKINQDKEIKSKMKTFDPIIDKYDNEFI